MKIGRYTDEEILEHLTEGEGRGFLGRSMYDAIMEEINQLTISLQAQEELTISWYNKTEQQNKEIERLKEEIDKCDIQRRVIKDLNKSLTEVHKEKDRLKKVLKYLELYFSNREDYELSQIIRDIKKANIEWLDKAIGSDKE